MKRFVPWLAAALIISGIFLTIGVAAQQVLRQDVNDPQIQLAEDVGTALQAGQQPQQLFPSQGTLTLSSTLAPFVVIYDSAGKPVAGNGYLGGKLAQVPVGVLTSASGHLYNAVTWQPASHIRIAAVSVKAGSYYVLSGRSLQEVERREDLVMKLMALGWVGSFFVLFIAFIIMSDPGELARASGRRKNR